MEQRASEAEKKLSDLTSCINDMIKIDVTDTAMSYSTEQTLNTVSIIVLNISWIYLLHYLYVLLCVCLLYTSPSPRDRQKSRMPSSA